MASSARIISGSLTKGSTAIGIGEAAVSGSIDAYRQGVYIRDIFDLSNAVNHKIRSNTGFKRTIKGKEISKTLFDDTLSPSTLTMMTASDGTPNTSAASSLKVSSPSIRGRVRSRIDHVREQRDLGQTHLYDDGTAFFETTPPTNGAAIVNVRDISTELPASLVDHSSVSALDGKIEPLETISSIDRSSIDHPFNARGIRASTGHGQDAFRKSFFVEDRYMIPENFTATEPFLDSVEVTAVGNPLHVSGAHGGIDVPGAFWENTSKIKAFNEHNHATDVEMYLNTGPALSAPVSGYAISSDIIDVLEGHTFYIDNDLGNFDKMATGGADYDHGPDSIAYGGLKK